MCGASTSSGRQKHGQKYVLANQRGSPQPVATCSMYISEAEVRTKCHDIATPGRRRFFKRYTIDPRGPRPRTNQQPTDKSWSGLTGLFFLSGAAWIDQQRCELISDKILPGIIWSLEIVNRITPNCRHTGCLFVRPRMQGDRRAQLCQPRRDSGELLEISFILSHSVASNRR